MKVASSRHRRSLGRDGRPAKRSRTEPTILFCSSESLTPGAVFTSLVSMLRFPVDIFAAVIFDMLDVKVGLEMVRRVWFVVCVANGRM